MHSRTLQSLPYRMLPLRLARLLPLILLAAASGCGVSLDIQRTPINEREYDLAVSRNGSPLLSAECRYIGKSPEDPELFRQHFEHNFEGGDTDFYKATLTNLTDRPMKVVRAEYTMRRGEYRGRSSFDAAAFAETWGGFEIPPGGSISRDTHFVWAKGNSNALIKTLTIQSETESGEQFEFTLAMPFQYQR